MEAVVQKEKDEESSPLFDQFAEVLMLGHDITLCIVAYIYKCYPRKILQISLDACWAAGHEQT